MFAAQRLAGYSPGKADLLRRAMGKKKKEILDKEFVPFQQGCRERGYSDKAIQAVWDVLVPFAGYAFNKAHSAAYGLVSYWTAHLKANYPAEYMAALLTSVAGDKDKSAVYLNECRRMGITVLPPDVNASTAIFTPVGGDIRFGLAAVRNVGTAVVDAIIAARTAKGAFASFSDFLRKVPVNVCNKRVIESLVKAGAFDSLGHPRKGLLLIHEQAIDSVIDVKRNEAMGQDSLFGGDATAEAAFEIGVPDGDWDKPVLLAFEREMLGLYVSDHPLLGVEHILSAATDCSVAQLLGSADGDSERAAGADRPDGQLVTVGGGDAGGPGRCHRGDVLPEHLRRVRGRAGRRRGRDREGPPRPPGRVAQAGRPGGDRAGHVLRPERPFRGLAAGAAVRRPGGGPAARGAAQPPGAGRGAPASVQRAPHDRGQAG